jgi:SSS family solute:Na+ symporter
LSQLNAVDLTVIGLYFGVVLLIAWWAARQGQDESADYFLAGRDVGWVAVGASLFASNIGSEHLVGLAGTGAASGLAVGHFEWLACLILLLLGWLFVPFYIRSGVFTMPEFLERRYNPACRWYLTSISVVGYVLTKISVSLYAGGIIIQQVTGLSLWYSAAAVVLVTGVYTALGGLRAVVYTDTLQALVLVIGTGILVFLGLDAVGGWSELQASAPEGFFSMWRPADDTEFPWTGIVLGAPILGVWYWCTDQYIVQRALSARNETEARRGSIFAGYLKILPVFLFVLPGVIAAALYADIGGNTTDQALPALVLRLMPTGLRGVLLAAMLAALMSSLSSVFNSTSTLVTWDVYRKLRPEASEKRLITVGRVATAVLVLLGLAWIPFMEHISSQLYIYLQSVQGYIAPPIAACFLLGLFVRRLNGAGAISALLTGFVLGGLRLGLELANGPGKTGLPPDSAWEWIAEINFLHFAALLFAVCAAVLWGVSLATAPPDEEKLEGLTWERAVAEGGSPDAKEGEEETPEPEPEGAPSLDVGLSVLLAGILAVLWTVFA